jgi:hypothetical protein
MVLVVPAGRYVATEAAIGSAGVTPSARMAGLDPNMDGSATEERGCGRSGQH